MRRLILILILFLAISASAKDFDIKVTLDGREALRIDDDGTFVWGKLTKGEPGEIAMKRLYERFTLNQLYTIIAVLDEMEKDPKKKNILLEFKELSHPPCEGQLLTHEHKPEKYILCSHIG